MSTEISINPPELGIAWQPTWHRPLGVIGRKCHPREGNDFQRPYLRTIGLHAVEVAFSGVAWFVAVMWLNSIGGPQLGLILAIGTGTLVMFATLLLLAISMAIDDPRWRLLRVDALVRIASTIAKSTRNLGSVLRKPTLVSRLDHFDRCPASSSGEIQ